MADQRRFEEDIIRWLLEHYRLLNTRTRWMLLDKEEEVFDRLNRNSLLPPVEQARMLTFRAFNWFFPGFPFKLASDLLTREHCKRMTFPKPFLGYGSSPVARAIESATEHHPAPDRFAVVFRCPYQKHVTDSLVAHNGLPPDTSRPGVHCCWRLDHGITAVMQDLQSFIATVDKMYPDHGWKGSALDPEYEVPVTT